MISVVLYGRNDAHGYNLHKRAAISLNCIAEVLSDPDDEILFVDYNTPDDLPTFVEAIADTLTARARRLLRVIRVRPDLHARRYAGRTHLAALEPVARNAAIRRSNPRNRWILSTNTDMVFLPRAGVQDLTAAVQDLPDGHYILPRFELPEPLWESFPRTDPAAIMRACDELGTELHLNEITVTHDYLRFDAPGDFQLVPRATLFAVSGFDERMILGWHVDSNLCKRLHRLFGSTGSLADRLRGYHCDHTRVTTLAHRMDLKLENDLHAFVYDVDEPVARHQRDSWGLPDAALEAIDLLDGPTARFATAVRAAVGEPQTSEYTSDANDVRNYVAYHSAHVLPYLAANLTVYPRTARFLYVGANLRLLRLLADCVARLGFEHPVRYAADLAGPDVTPAQTSPAVPVAGGTDDGSALDLLRAGDALVFDFGFDVADGPGAVVRATDWPRRQRHQLGALARCFEACAEQCGRTFAAAPREAPAFIVVNANHYVFSRFVDQFLLIPQTPHNTRVRKGRVRVGEERLHRSHRWRTTQDELRADFGYDLGELPGGLTAGDSVDFTVSGSSSHWKHGQWGRMDLYGTWTDGHRAEVLLSLDPAPQSDLIAKVTVTEAFIGPGGDPIRVNVRLGDRLLAAWQFAYRWHLYERELLLPSRLLAGAATCRLVFEVENPQSVVLAARAAGQDTGWDSPEELGIKIQRIALRALDDDRDRYRLGQVLDFTRESAGDAALGPGWGAPDGLGRWTEGAESTLVFRLGGSADAPVPATFVFSDCMVDASAPTLPVQVVVNDVVVEEWTFGPGRAPHVRSFEIAAEQVQADHGVVIAFRIADPRSPASFGWSSDGRPLGIRLARACLGAGALSTRLPQPGLRLRWRAALIDAPGMARAALAAVLRRARSLATRRSAPIDRRA